MHQGVCLINVHCTGGLEVLLQISSDSCGLHRPVVQREHKLYEPYDNVGAAGGVDLVGSLSGHKRPATDNAGSDSYHHHKI